MRRERQEKGRRRARSRRNGEFSRGGLAYR